MPGFEVVGPEELAALQNIFSESNGVLFAHGFDALRNGRFRVREFEAEMSKKLNVAHCLAVSSGTAALFVALKSLGIKPGDEVITQSFTFIATIEAILELGAVPVVVDIDESLNMCPKSLAGAITPRTKAIIPVHMLGNPARMDEILQISKQNKIPVVDDACEALGASYKGQAIGSLGDLSCFSLDFGKTITSGEGGFITTNSSELFQKMKEYHDHGHQFLPGIPRGRDTAGRSGFNFRMSEMQGAVARAQLAKLDFIVESNRKNKKLLKDYLEETLQGRIQFRSITDAQELADTLMFFLPNQEATTKIVTALAQEGVGTKNVPDAMNWHFAPYWEHIWQTSERYASTWKTTWSKSQDLLGRCISLPIMVKWDEQKILEIGAKVSVAVKKFV